MVDYKKSARLLISALKKFRSILIIVKGSPDPDAIASSFAIKLLCDHLQIKSTIISAQKLSLQQNKEMVKLLDIPVKFDNPINIISDFDAYVITDHQAAGYPEIFKELSCAAHIDHHDKIEDDISADFRLILANAGSTSTIIALLLEAAEIKLDPEKMKLAASALIIGIQTDTDKYDHAGEMDYRALNYLSALSDNMLINTISDIGISDYTIQLLGKAINNRILYKDWLITGVGYIDEGNRDSIAIAADFLLKNKEASTVIVFAAVADSENKKLIVDASFRSLKENLNLNQIIKEITTHGGARKFKGAYQIDIGYFINCPDRELLWKVIEMTTVDVLKQQRDGVYMLGIKGVYNNIKSRLLGALSR